MSEPKICVLGGSADDEKMVYALVQRMGLSGNLNKSEPNIVIRPNQGVDIVDPLSPIRDICTFYLLPSDAISLESGLRRAVDKVRESPQKLVPGFTIIIPCYQHQKEVVEALDSAIATAPDEIVVLDDYSTPAVVLPTDFGHPIAPTIRLIRNQHNMGLGATRNRGFMEANTEWVLPLDADDILMLEGLTQLWEVARKADPRVGMICGNWQGFRDIPGAALYHETKRGALELAGLLQGNWQPCTAMIRRRAWEEVRAVNGSGYDEWISRMGGYEDWLFWLEMLACAWTSLKVETLVFRYRMHPDGHSMVHGARKNEEEIKRYMAHRLWKDYRIFMPHKAREEK